MFIDANSERGPATMQMKNNKACDPDGIPAEILKFGGEKLTNGVYELISKIWHDK